MRIFHCFPWLSLDVLGLCLFSCSSSAPLCLHVHTLSQTCTRESANMERHWPAPCLDTGSVHPFLLSCLQSTTSLSLLSLETVKYPGLAKGPPADCPSSQEHGPSTLGALELSPHWCLTSAEPTCLSHLRISKPSFLPRIAFCLRECVHTPCYILQMPKASDIWFLCAYSLNFWKALTSLSLYIDTRQRAGSISFPFIVIVQECLTGQGLGNWLPK